MPEETIDAIERFHRRREARLRQRLDEAKDLMKKYRILKAIYNNQKFERQFLQKYLDIGGKSSTIKLSVTTQDGGSGSGNHNHAGILGKVGGSAPSGQTLGSGTEAERDHELKGVKPATQQKYNLARSSEKLITPVMQSIASELGCEMTGLEFSVKTGSSVSEKIERKKASGMTEEEAISSMKDIVRYTQLSDHSAIVKDAIATREKLEAKGYEITEVDNKWLKKDADYKGIHMTVVSPEGQSFELQFHSPESLSVKDKNHKLYEESRKPDTPAPRKKELQAQMRANTASMPDPDGIDGLQNFEKGEGNDS